MANKKVIIIPPRNMFSEFIKTKNNLLRVAIYSETFGPFQSVCDADYHYFYFLHFYENWDYIGFFTNNENNCKSRNDFSKLLSLCANGKIDLVVCEAMGDLYDANNNKAKSISQLKSINIPIYSIKDNLIIR